MLGGCHRFSLWAMAGHSGWFLWTTTNTWMPSAHVLVRPSYRCHQQKWSSCTCGAPKVKQSGPCNLELQQHCQWQFHVLILVTVCGLTIGEALKLYCRGSQYRMRITWFTMFSWALRVPFTSGKSCIIDWSHWFGRNSETRGCGGGQWDCVVGHFSVGLTNVDA